jgi:hypothetical protein
MEPQQACDPARLSAVRARQIRLTQRQTCLPTIIRHSRYRARDAFGQQGGGGEPSTSALRPGRDIDSRASRGRTVWRCSPAVARLRTGWNDNNEYEIWDEAAASHGFGRPIPIERARPLQPLLMTRASYEAQAARFPGERVFTVTRAGPPGIQRYAQTWSGDNTTSWRTLRWNIRMGLTMSLSGMFNVGHDVGGFAGPVPDPELLVRWVQSATFSPRFT